MPPTDWQPGSRAVVGVRRDVAVERRAVAGDVEEAVSRFVDPLAEHRVQVHRLVVAARDLRALLREARERRLGVVQEVRVRVELVEPVGARSRAGSASGCSRPSSSGSGGAASPTARSRTGRGSSRSCGRAPVVAASPRGCRRAAWRSSGRAVDVRPRARRELQQVDRLGLAVVGSRVGEVALLRRLG